VQQFHQPCRDLRIGWYLLEDPIDLPGTRAQGIIAGEFPEHRDEAILHLLPMLEAKLQQARARQGKLLDGLALADGAGKTDAAACGVQMKLDFRRLAIDAPLPGDGKALCLNVDRNRDQHIEVTPAVSEAGLEMARGGAAAVGPEGMRNRHVPELVAAFN